MTNKKIDLEMLRQVCDEIFRFVIEDLNIENVELDKNFYWTLSDEERFDIEKLPTIKRIGSLYDDYEFIEPLLHDKDQAIPLMFEHIAPILATLAQKLPNFK